MDSNEEAGTTRRLDDADEEDCMNSNREKHDGGCQRAVPDTESSF